MATPSRRRAILAAYLAPALALAVAACGSGAATTAPSGTTIPTAAPTSPSAATDVPAQPTDGGISLPSFVLPSFNSDQELEAMFPDSIDGETVQVISLSGADFLDAGASPELSGVLTELGSTPDDLSVAFGGAGDLTIIAYRLKGVDASTMLAALQTAFAAADSATISDTTLGGKSVKKLVSSDSDLGTSYLYTTGDVVFILGGDGVTDAVLNEAFSKLP